MKTLEITLYKFDELSEEAKQRAFGNWEPDTSYVYDDAHETVKKFHEVFGTKTGHRSWLDVITDHIEDNIMDLTGLRLRKYMINNFWNQIYKGKYYSLWSEKEQNPHYREVGGAPWGKLKERYSRVMFDNCCPLTGVCYDDSLLSPIIELIDNYDTNKHESVTFEDLINECFDELKKDIENEVEARQSIEEFEQEVDDEEIFTEDGERF